MWHHHMLITQNLDDEWQTELCCYLKSVPANVNADTDIVEWWLDNHKLYPTLDQIALDVLSCQASSVPQASLVGNTRLNSEEIDQITLCKYADFLSAENELQEWEAS
ncbi:hypothetical protein DXG01_004311 [Tephrocybe rancida]|nr:hypothetical protein DXG01_004311 [Tephrocybe rancida]